MVQAEALYCTQNSKLLGFRNLKSYVSKQKIALSQEYTGKKIFEVKIWLSNAHKYKTRNRLRELEDELYIFAWKVNDPLSTEDLLKDTVVETAFPNIQLLLKIYLLILSSEAVVERGFSKMSQLITKKRTSLEDNGLEMLMRISYHKNPHPWMMWNKFSKIGKVKKNVEYFLVICECKQPSFHCSIFSKFDFSLKYKLLQVYYEAQIWPFCSQKLKFFKQVWHDFLQLR